MIYYNPVTNDKKSLEDLAKQYNASLPIDIEEFKGYYKVYTSSYPEHDQYDHVVPSVIQKIDNKYYQMYEVRKESKDNKITRYKQLVKEILNDFAQEKDYDTIESLCSYANSNNLTYRQEALFAIQYREELWEEAYKLINDIKDNNAELNSDGDFIALLPLRQWSDLNI